MDKLPSVIAREKELQRLADEAGRKALESIEKEAEEQDTWKQLFSKFKINRTQQKETLMHHFLLSYVTQ